MKLDEWRFSFEIAWDDLWFRWQSIAILSLFCVSSFWFLWKLIPEGLEKGLLIFHYNQYLGIDEVHHWLWIFVYVGVIFLIIAADFALSLALFRHDRIASRLLLCTGAFFAILMAIVSHVIISINI